MGDEIMTENWKEAVISKISLAIYVKPDTGKHIHQDRPFHGLVLNEETTVRDYCFADGRVLHTNGGELFYLPKSSSYRVKTIRLGGCYAINFDADITDEPFTVRFRSTDTVLKLFKAAEKAWRQQDESRQLVVMKTLYEIILLMRSERQKQYRPDAQLCLIAPAVEKISADFTENELSVAELAALCGISEAYFRRLFIGKFGMTPKEYIIALRIGYARQLLESGQFTVGETARLCGYAEVSHFSREFKKRVGMPPNGYRPPRR